jgi:hypothetical protein
MRRYLSIRSSIGASKSRPPRTRPASHPVIHGLAGMAGHRRDGRRPSPLSAARLSRPLRMWTENDTWFSSEEGEKGRIQVGQFAHLIAAITTSSPAGKARSPLPRRSGRLSARGSSISGDFTSLDASALPPAMADWLPVRSFGGYGNWVGADRKTQPLTASAMQMCECANACRAHGSDHAWAWSTDSRSPVSGASCWPV